MDQLAASFYLTVRQGPQPGTVIPLQGSSISIGRQMGNQVLIDDPQISRRHARFSWQVSGYVLEDLGSANGSWVNDRRVTQPTLLRSGDVICFGEPVVLEFSGQTQGPADGDMTFVEPVPGVVAAPPPPLPPSVPPAGGQVSPPPSRGSGPNPLLVGLGGFLLIGVVVLLLLAAVAGVYLLTRDSGTPPRTAQAPTSAAELPPTGTPYPTYTPYPTPTDSPVPPSATPLPSHTPTPTGTPTPADTPPLPSESTPLPPTQGPSPSPGKIVFASDRDGNEEIYVMNADGSQVTRLTDDPAQDQFPAWTPDGRRIAFVSNRDGNPDIYVMNADGSQVIRLTDDPAVDYHPAWSPQGSGILFDSDRENMMGDIWVMSHTGADQVRLQENGRAPAWSPDGSQLAAIFRFGSFVHVGLMPIDGSSDPQPLVSLDANMFPDWSPDGQRIAFENVIGPDGAQIMVVNKDGTNLNTLTPDSGQVNLHPSWSPDGSQIVFVSDRDGKDSIYVMDADGSDVQRLTDPGTWDGAPDWGP